MSEYDTIYKVMTKAGGFDAVFDADDSPVEFRGDQNAISYFRFFLDDARGDDGHSLNEKTLTPRDLYMFCQQKNSGNIVLPPLEHLIDFELEIEQMNQDDTVFDSVSDIAIKTNLDKKIHENAATSPLSDIKEPTAKEAQNGDYENAKIKISGLKIEIENPYGSMRKGIDDNGKQWECELKDNYGEISNTEGADGDPIDIFLKPHLTQQQADKINVVFIIDQINPKTGKFDEHKVVMGYETKSQSEKAYLSNYEKNWNGIGKITELSMTDFKKWLKKGDLTKLASEMVLDDATQQDTAPMQVSGVEKLKLVKELGSIRADLKGDTATGVQKLKMAKRISEIRLILLGMKPAENTITPEGKENKVKTAKGTEVVTGFTVLEAADLITSHDYQGNLNPLYPQELQPRDRERAESIAWVAKTSKNLDVDSLGKTRRADSGAPIIGSDKVVESGNGRTMALKEAYRTGQAQEYRDWLIEEAENFGLSAEKISAMREPVLVRVRTSAIKREDFVVEANQDDKLAMTATEKARSDAKRLTSDLVSKMVDGDLSSSVNKSFILGFLASLGDAESAQYSTTSGEPTKQLYDRLQAAVFARAYNDDRLLELMADDAKPEIKNIIVALNSAAPNFIQAQSLNEKEHSNVTNKLADSIQISLDKEAIDTIIKATNVIMDAKNKGLSIEEFLNQGDMFGNGIDATIGAMALFIKENNRSSGRLSVAFKEMASFVNNELASKQNQSLFGDDEVISLNDVLKAANDALKKQYGGDQQDLKGAVKKGGFIDVFTETRGKKELREQWQKEQDEKLANGETEKSESEKQQDLNKAAYEEQESNKITVVWERKDASDSTKDLSIFTKGGRFFADWSGTIKAFDTMEIAKGQIKKWADGLGIDDVFGNEITPSVEVIEPTPEIIEPVEPTPTPAPTKPTESTELTQARAKLDQHQQLQKRMKDANKVIKSKTMSDETKRTQLAAQGFSDKQINDIMQPDYAGRIGFADYQLTNNNAAIKNTQKRVDELEARELSQAKAESGERETSYEFDGGMIELDYDADRLKVDFDEKPSADVISTLKSSGFKWSPTNSVWQRQLTDNAIYTANRLFKTEIKTAKQVMNEPVAPPVIEPTPPQNETADIDAAERNKQWFAQQEEMQAIADAKSKAAFDKKMGEAKVMIETLAAKGMTPMDRLVEINNQNQKLEIDAELTELETLIGAGDIFDEKMDALIEKIDGLGLMTQFEPKLLQLDRDNSNANAKGI